jgi:hypothetical protein
MRQLTLDGREVTHPLVVGPQLNPRQRAVLAYIRERDVVRTAEVGRQIHVQRGVPCRSPYTGKETNVIACCFTARNDGGEWLLRLRTRGLVERIGRGLWRATAAPEEAWPHRAVSSEIADEIVRLYSDEGLSQEEIGQRLIFAQSTVGDVLRNRGVRARRRRNVHARLDDDTILRTMELYGRGYSAREVGDLLGVTEGAVLYRVHRYGRGGVRHGAEAHTIPGARRRNRSAAPVSA